MLPGDRGVAPLPSSRRCPVLPGWPPRASAQKAGSPSQTPAPTRSHSLRRTLARLAPGTARPSGQAPVASPLPPVQQVPFPGKAAFLARPANSPSSGPPQRSALPTGSAVVLRPLLTPAASARASRPRVTGLPGISDRPPQVRTLTFPAPSPHLPHRPLVASGFAALGQLARPAQPPMRFVSLESQVCLQLPPDPASRRRPCLQLTVGATNPRRGLSPPSQRSCWAHLGGAGPARGAGPTL